MTETTTATVHDALTAALTEHTHCDYWFGSEGRNVTYECGISFPVSGGVISLVAINREHTVRALLDSSAADALRAEGWDAAVEKVYADRFREAVGEDRPGFPANPYRAPRQETR